MKKLQFCIHFPFSASDLDPCKRDHSRVQSPDVYRLDFSDDGEEQSKELGSMNPSKNDTAHCDNQTDVTDSCDIYNNGSEKSKCDIESKQFGGEVEDTSQVVSVQTSTKVSDNKDVNENVNAVNSVRETLVDTSAKKKTGTKSKDIWKDPGESAHVGSPVNNYSSNRPKKKADSEKTRSQISSSSWKNQESSTR